MSSIYKITNLINNKIYIGYTSRTIERRFYEHKRDSFSKSDKSQNSCLHQAIKKYGKENFIIEEILNFNESEQDWRELEQYYISFYNSLAPNGYNILVGGDSPPVKYGNDNFKTKLSDEELAFLCEDLKNNLNLSYKDLSKKYNISESQLYNINSGKSRFNNNLTYPIRKYSQDEEYALQVIHILTNDKTLSNQKIADLIPNYFKANEIASINNGKKYAYLWEGTFPIRKEKVPNDYDKKQEIAKEILQYIEKNPKISSIQIQRELNYGRCIVEKVLKGIYPYNIENQSYPIKLNK